MSFDGSNDYVEVSDSESLDITNAITLEAWIYRNVDSGTSEWLISKWKTTGNKRSYYLAINPDDRLKMAISKDGSTGDGHTYEALSSSTISTGQWYHFIGVYDGSYLRTYINGVANGTPFAYSDDMFSGTGKLMMSTYEELGAFNFNGTIDEVRIYNRALSAEEIAEHYRVGAAKFKINPNGN